MLGIVTVPPDSCSSGNIARGVSSAGDAAGVRPRLASFRLGSGGVIACVVEGVYVARDIAML